MSIRFIEVEWHQTKIANQKEVDVEQLTEVGVTEEEFMCFLEDEIEDLSDEVQDACSNLIMDLDTLDSYEDMWTMRKGGFDTTYEFGELN
ncbi:hypothetical protein N9159_00005 [bacterium]|jgi:hypothetical protein|nr:hypothetical protein [bacterium]|tara:strand:+ start:108 stop:377 length:270 start_codon:yes stop_codon:yes gene_type:complete